MFQQHQKTKQKNKNKLSWSCEGKHHTLPTELKDQQLLQSC